MFRSSLLCRGTVVGLWVVTGSLLAVATGRTVLYYVVPAFALWLFLHLSNMKIEIADGCLIRQTGNIFKHKSIIMLKNIFHIQIIVFRPWRPAFIRLYSWGDRLVIIGLDGRQAQFIERSIRG